MSRREPAGNGSLLIQQADLLRYMVCTYCIYLYKNVDKHMYVETGDAPGPFSSKGVFNQSNHPST